MEQTEKLIESMLQFLESSNDEDDEHSYTYEPVYETTASTISSQVGSVSGSKSDELYEEELPMTNDSFEAEEISTDYDEENENQEAKLKLEISSEDDASNESEPESDGEPFFLIDPNEDTKYAEDAIEVENTGTVSPDNDSDVSSTVSSESFCLRKYPTQVKPRRSRFFRRLTINTIYIREELDKIKLEYPLYSPPKELPRRPKVEDINYKERLYAGPVFARRRHGEESSDIPPDPFIEEVNRCIYGKPDNQPLEGSEEYHKAAENYAIYGKSFLCVPSRESSPSTQSTDLDFSSVETLKESSEVERTLSSSTSYEELLESDYNLSPTTEIEDDSNSMNSSPPSIPTLPTFLQSPPPYGSSESYSPIFNNSTQLNFAALAATAPPIFVPTFPPPSNKAYSPPQNQNQYFPYPQTFFSPPNITPYFSVAASETYYTMDHQRQRAAYQQQVYTNYHTQIGPNMPINQNFYHPQQQYVTPVNTYIQCNQAQYNFNHDHISRAQGPMTTVPNREHNINSYNENTSRFQTYQSQYFCPILIQQPPYPGIQYQHQQLPYVPRPRIPHTVSSPHTIQERATAIRFRPPMQVHRNSTYNTYIPPCRPPPPYRYQRYINPSYINPSNINDIRHGNSPRTNYHNKFTSTNNMTSSNSNNNKSNNGSYRQFTKRGSESPPTTTKSASSQTTILNRTKIDKEMPELLETIVDSNETDVSDIENIDEIS